MVICDLRIATGLFCAIIAWFLSPIIPGDSMRITMNGLGSAVRKRFPCGFGSSPFFVVLFLKWYNDEEYFVSTSKQ